MSRIGPGLRRIQRVMNAMLQMDKLDLKRLQQAYNGE
jgi:hypothetical protein